MNLNTSLINVPKINLPRRDGQIAIAKMLSDMDTELTALEARRNKTRDQKKL
jgi:type I restriction enzyme, S subunit